MKSKSKDLSLKAQVEAKIDSMLSLGKLTLVQVRTLEIDELRIMFSYFSRKLNELKGSQFDDFYDKIEDIMPEDTKDQIWNSRHNTITWAISTFTQENGRLPSTHEIANKSGISVYSVTKHLKEYSKDNKYLDTLDQFEFLKSKVLAKVFKFAVNGDMQAAKLYFSVVGTLKAEDQNKRVINTQNNYIQINQFKLSLEAIEQLEPEQLKQIESVLQQVVIRK